MKHRKLFLYLAGIFFFMMCGSLWNEFVASGDADSSPSVPGDAASRDSVKPAVRKSYYAVPKAKVESFPFDPNEADSTQLLRLGLTPAQVRSIYRHRAKGYVYSRVEDFARTPFMTKGQWERLRPLIRIGDQYRLLDDNLDLSFRMANGAERSESNPDPSTLCSRTANVAEPQATVNGQQSAVADEPQAVSTVNCQLSIINLNEASFKELVHHPFLSYGQVKAIKNFQKKYGRIRNMTELLILPEFSVEDTLRLSPYLQF